MEEMFLRATLPFPLELPRVNIAKGSLSFTQSQQKGERRIEVRICLVKPLKRLKCLNERLSQQGLKLDCANFRLAFFLDTHSFLIDDSSMLV